MKQQIFQIDAFTDKLYSGNPAAVCILKEWLGEDQMQNIAAENNLAETAFCVANTDHYEIRWFTPTVEVDLCGHATLASAHVLFQYYDHPSDIIEFQSLNSGVLKVRRNEDLLTLDFPADVQTETIMPFNILDIFGIEPIKVLKGKTDFLFVFSNEDEIASLDPDLRLLNELDARGVIVTAKGNEVDFVSRFFAPQSGVDEDPVTGSAHTSLTPFWASELNKPSMTARQISRRGGDLVCELKRDRVLISGKAVTYLIGEIDI